jgi:hypothetical protein
MNRICWWLMDRVSRVLEPDERDAVQGDFVESGETGARGLRDVLGLATRRQMALWRDWRPWLVLAGVAVPLGLLLSFVASRVTGNGAVYSWMYLSNWDPALLEQRAFWIVLGQTLGPALPNVAALVCLSWSLGLALGAAARRTLPVHAILFCLVLLCGEFLATPHYLRLQAHSIQDALGGGPLEIGHDNDAVFSLNFYRVAFPLWAQIMLVWIPSIWGMRQGSGMPIRMRTIFWGPALALMAVLAARQGTWWLALEAHDLAWLQRSSQMPPLVFAMAGPAVYFTAARWKRWRTTKTSRRTT